MEPQKLRPSQTNIAVAIPEWLRFDLDAIKRVQWQCFRGTSTRRLPDANPGVNHTPGVPVDDGGPGDDADDDLIS